jgi:protein-disulfide isomerase
MIRRWPARMRGLVVATALLGAAVGPWGVRAEEPAPLTPAQIEQFEKVIRDYLLRHPEVIIDAINELERRDLAATAEAQKQAIAARAEDLFKDANDPAGGNLEGSVTIVEFFDYRCPYCKAVAADLMKAIEEDGDTRIVFKEFPILGPESTYAAKAALAAHRQGRYAAFHQALMAVKGQLDEAAVLAAAGAVGLDVARLKADLEAPEITAIIDRNHALAAALKINGTPAFVIGDIVIPGAMSLEELKQLIKTQRSS